jgi:RimJ/RimL family protein N-acetyltransferase
VKVAVERIVSGGQTGADRAALDWAIANGIPHGGWCPRGRTAEDGPIDSRYQLNETRSADYVQRTEWNVRDSDGTVVFSIAKNLTGGSRETMELARKHRKPVLHLCKDGGHVSPERQLADFIREHRIQVLNVAGPRVSEEPEIAAFVTVVLAAALKPDEASCDAAPPTIETDRLILRPLVPSDAPDLARLAGRREIADTTISIPHPYSEDQARIWIATHTFEANDKEIVFALTLKDTGTLIGTMGLRDIEAEHSQAEMGFWIAVEHWGRGYATEAAMAVVRYAFRTLNLNRVYAHHMARNPASGRVLEKVGMKREGLLRQRVKKWGVFEDVVILAVLRTDWPSPSR